MAPPPATLKILPEAFVFDVFGTVFDWRSTVTEHLEQAISQKLTSLDAIGAAPNKPDLSTPASLRSFCETFAAEWRDSYKDFVRTLGTKGNNSTSNSNSGAGSGPLLSSSPDRYITIDTHHLRSLSSLLEKYSLTSLFTPAEVTQISKIWHALKSWEDSKPGIQELKQLAIVSTLSNGNVRLLVDLQRNSGVAFDMTLSGQLWRGYKPDRKVYVGACEVLGFGDEGAWEEDGDGDKDKMKRSLGEEKWRQQERGKVAMVAAHIGDLRAAKGCGLTTIYIERPGEDDEQDAIDKYVKNGEDWIDMWVTHAEGGILEVSKRLKELKAETSV
ncbi:hypothetical protein H072_3686 [Dactylellina haptotyla CBS 200.50]|uniref:Haloacid dehalogenase, type II n=1 Tax=Dactylellina haptotyla (strain CBS 200.50) TaxID=1284197 RepID=S8AHP1_DACHA|nr:hypothetical protein H072_3686 [Dactylellina haptotyla CBS 200.50]